MNPVGTVSTDCAALLSAKGILATGKKKFGKTLLDNRLKFRSFSLVTCGRDRYSPGL